MLLLINWVLVLDQKVKLNTALMPASAGLPSFLVITVLLSQLVAVNVFLIGQHIRACSLGATALTATSAEVKQAMVMYNKNIEVHHQLPVLPCELC